MKTLLSFLLGGLLAYSFTSCSLTKEYVLTREYHRVQAGETVWEIAERNFHRQDRYQNLNEWVYVVRKANSLDKRPFVFANDIIELPIYKEVAK